MGNLSSELLRRLKDKANNQASSELDALEKLFAGFEEELAQDPDLKQAARRDKVKAKQAELKEGGKQADKKDWVTNTYDSLVADVLVPLDKDPGLLISPKPIAEREVDELYWLLGERVQRFKLVVTEGMASKVVARDNVTAVAKLLGERGESAQEIGAFVQAERQKQPSIAELYQRLRLHVGIASYKGKVQGGKKARDRAVKNAEAYVDRLKQRGESDEKVTAFMQAVIEGGR